MRRTLGTPGLVLAALLTLGLVGCGQDDTATDPAGEQASQPSDEPTPEVGDDGPVTFTQVDILTHPEEAGAVSTTPVALDTEAAVAEFAGQFTGARMADEIRAAVSSAPDVGPDQTLVGAVLVIGCDRPAEVSVERVDGEVQVSPVMPKRQVQCFAPMTSVAILVVDTVKLGGVVS